MVIRRGSLPLNNPHLLTMLLQEVCNCLKKGRWSDASSEEKLEEVLSLSFNDMTEEGRNMFLDCVSVLHGQDYKTAIAAWSGWWTQPREEFEQLQARSLVSVDTSGRLAVHDVLRTLGQSLLKKKHKEYDYYGSRVWVDYNRKLVKLSEVSGMVVCV
jgi:hypothetical protein